MTLTAQLDFAKREKNAIEHQLKKMVEMYKNMLSEMEAKNEARLNKVQNKFADDMLKMIADKQEEAKYFTAEKEHL